MKKHGKKITAIIVMGVLLSACQHANPLKVHPVKESAAFLVNASANVEKRLQFDIAHNAYGYAYLECMEGHKSVEIHCEALYQGIVAFAKENHYSGFNTLTVSDLTNPNLFEILSDEYAELAATTWPHFFPVSKV